nr:DUF349 domain-containing protein [Halomonas elongata]
MPRDQAEAIGRRFGRIRHALQALIEQRAGEVAEAKRQLIDEARQLRDSEQAPAQRAENAKALQKRWRALGRAPAKKRKPCGTTSATSATKSSPAGMPLANSMTRATRPSSRPCRP